MAKPYFDAYIALQELAKASDDLYRSTEKSKLLYTEELDKLKVKNHSGQFMFPSASTPELTKIKNYLDQMLLCTRKHSEWGRKIHGVMMGYVREMQSAHKNLSKNRPVGFQNADVTIGTNEPFAKAIQHKHTVSPDNSAVNKMIAKAANQLTGESGETPLPTQRKIIDMMINDNTNWWPFDIKDLHSLNPEADLWGGIIPLTAFAKKASDQILAQLIKYSPKVRGLNPATINSLSNVVTKTFIGSAPVKRRSNTIFQSSGMPQATDAKVITIKIVYGHPRPFNIPHGIICIRKAVFVAIKVNGALQVNLQQTTDDKNVLRRYDILV